MKNLLIASLCILSFSTLSAQDNKPHAQITWCHFPGGPIRKAQIDSISKHKCVMFQGAAVSQFQMTLVPKEGNKMPVESASIKGNIVPDNYIQLMSKLPKSSMIFFSNILGKNSDGSFFNMKQGPTFVIVD